MIFPTSLAQSKRIGKPTQFPILPVGGAAAFVGALDGVPDLVHVWCIARRWLSAYEGRLARLRRSSDQVEADFSYDADGNMDTAAIEAWAGGSAFITVIADQVGGDDVSQAAAGNQPFYVASGQNGRPVGRFDGSDDYLQKTFALNQPEHILILWKSITRAGLEVVFDGTTSDTMELRHNNSNPDLMDVYAGAFLTQTAPYASAYQIATILFNGASSSMYINGVLHANGNAGNANAGGISIARRPIGGRVANIETGTIVIADADLSTSRQVAETAVNDYWNVF